MINISIEKNGLFQTCLDKLDDYFILDLKLLTSKGYYLNLENLGDKIKFKCFTSLPKKLNISNEEVVVSIPNGAYNSTQLRRLAQIVEELISLEEFKFFKFFEFFLDNFENDFNNKEYFFLDKNEKPYIELTEESNILIKNIYEKNLNNLQLNENLKPLLYSNIKKKISIMCNLLDHFTKNTNLLIEQVMDKFDEKASNLNRKLQVAENKMLLQEAKVNRLNNIAWEILKQYEIEEKFLSTSDEETTVNLTDDRVIGTKRTAEKILTLQEALQLRRSHGAEGLPEDFGSPDKLLQLEKTQDISNKVIENNLKLIDQSADKRNLVWDPLEKNHFPAHVHFEKINFKNRELLHPASMQLEKIKLGKFLMEKKNTEKKMIKPTNDKIYDPIFDYSLRNLCEIEDKKVFNLKNNNATVFSYLGRPIPLLSHQYLDPIPKQNVMESIQLSMTTEILKNKDWQIFGRPIERRDMKLKSPESLKVKPLKHKLNEFKIPNKDVYNVLL